MASGEIRWAATPRAERIELWSIGKAEALGDPSAMLTRHIFQIAYLDGITRQNRVLFMGQYFRIVQISQASRLHGLELQCEVLREAEPA